MYLFIKGSVILLKWYITNRVYCDIEKHPILINSIILNRLEALRFLVKRETAQIVD